MLFFLQHFQVSGSNQPAGNLYPDGDLATNTEKNDAYKEYNPYDYDNVK
jgi:hypothetical protein